MIKISPVRAGSYRALMHHVILADDVNVPLVENLERRALGMTIAFFSDRWK